MFHEMGITKKINHVNIAPKIYVNEDENVFEPLEDSEPVIDSSEESDALTAEAKASFTQRTQEHIEQDMLGKCHAYYGLDIYQR